MTDLQTIWYVLIGVLLTVYLMLDGFDLGVGFWHLFTRRDDWRGTMISAVAPVWDGNEVWLLAGGGAVFAAFPHAYATVFSGLYAPLILVLFALILRAVSIEFRGKVSSGRWHDAWDGGFAAGSIVVAVLLGVAMGNIMRGLPLDGQMEFTGSFVGLLNPYALLVGVVALAMFATHGAIYLALKTEGELARLARKWAGVASCVYLAGVVVVMIVTASTQGQLLKNYRAIPSLAVLPAAQVTAIVLLGLSVLRGRLVQAFVCSAIAIVAGMVAIATAIFPNLVPAVNDAALSLTAANASSSELTLKIMLVMVAIGLPVVIGYTIWSYRVFAHKVGPDEAY